MALVVTDILNRYDHEDAAPLMGSVRAALPGICHLVEPIVPVAQAMDVPW